MALSYESPTVPSSRISEIERGARNLPELKQRAQTLDNDRSIKIQSRSHSWLSLPVR